MTNEVYCCLQILGFLFHFSIAEPIRGDNVVMANEGEFPFVAALIKKTNCSNVERGLICTGVLISERLVLTAAHCFEKVSLDDMQIVLGSVDLRHGVRYDVSKRITYNEWAEIEGVHKAIIKNDIAVIKLSEKVHKNVSISAEFSYKKRSKLENRNVTMLGWGHTSLSSNRTVRYLRKTILTVLTSEECQQKIHELINETVHVEDSVFCTKAEPFATSGCGDSGGPILTEKQKLVAINLGVCPEYTALLPHQMNNVVNVHTGVYYYNTFILDMLWYF